MTTTVTPLQLHILLWQREIVRRLTAAASLEAHPVRLHKGGYHNDSQH